MGIVHNMVRLLPNGSTICPSAGFSILTPAGGRTYLKSDEGESEIDSCNE
jgi:hypothetical protein